MKTYYTSFYGSVLWDLSHPAISALCTTWRKGLRRICGIPYCTHSNLLPIISRYLPLWDELCYRNAAFIKSCIESDSPIVSAVARYGVYYGRMNSHIGRNAFLLRSLMSYVLLDVCSHVMLTSIFLHSLERQCCFYSSCCSLEMVALVVPCCHRMTLTLMSLLILYAHLDANKL